MPRSFLPLGPPGTEETFARLRTGDLSCPRRRRTDHRGPAAPVRVVPSSPAEEPRLVPVVVSDVDDVHAGGGGCCDAFVGVFVGEALVGEDAEEAGGVEVGVGGGFGGGDVVAADDGPGEVVEADDGQAVADDVAVVRGYDRDGGMLGGRARGCRGGGDRPDEVGVGEPVGAGGFDEGLVGQGCGRLGRRRGRLRVVGGPRQPRPGPLRPYRGPRR